MATSAIENLHKRYGSGAVFQCTDCSKSVVQVADGPIIIFDKSGNSIQSFTPPDRPVPQALETDFTCRYSPNCALNRFRDSRPFPPVNLHPESDPQE